MPRLSVGEIVKLASMLIEVPGYLTVGSACNKVIYYSSKAGAVHIWSLDPSTGVTRRLVDKPINFVARPRRDSPYIIYCRDVSGGREQHKVFYVDINRPEERPFTDMHPMRIWGIAFDGVRVAFTGVKEDIAVYMSKHGGSAEKIASIGAPAYVSDVSEKYIVGYGMLRKDPRSMEIFIIDLGTGSLKIYTPKEGSVNKYPIIHGDSIVFESNFEGRNKLYKYDPETGELTEIRFGGGDYYSYQPVEHVYYGYTGDGRIWVVGKRDGRTRLFIDGYWIKTPEGDIGYPAFTGDKVYVSFSKLNTPPRIIEIDVKTGSTRTVIDNKLPKEIEERIGDVRFVRYKSFDGLEIPMYILESRVAGKPGPTVVYVHGGPWAEVDDSWNKMIAAIAIMGYHVLAPNYRGSTGYGEEFRLLDIGDPGGGDLQDIIYAARWAVNEGLADKDRIAIMGYSYGGYMTLLALGKSPDLWRCGVAGASVSDWEEMYELSDPLFKKFIEILFDNKMELLKERSPITYVGNVKRPVCIIHPQNDSRTPLKPVLKYIMRLMELGKTFEAHIIPDMGHAIVTLEDFAKILLPGLTFLEKYMKE